MAEMKQRMGAVFSQFSRWMPRGHAEISLVANVSVEAVLQVVHHLLDFDFAVRIVASTPSTVTGLFGGGNLGVLPVIVTVSAAPLGRGQSQVVVRGLAQERFFRPKEASDVTTRAIARELARRLAA